MFLKTKRIVILAQTIFASSILFAQTQPTTPQGSQVPESIISLGHGSYYPKHALLVDKKARKTSVWERRGEEFVQIQEFDSDQGKKSGDKTIRDDHRTPEGVYFLQQKLEGPQLPFELYGVRAFTTDYPNLFDRRLKKTGSGIWLHAIPEETTLSRGSRGCVVVRNKSIMELSQYVELGKTPIIILDHIEWIPQSQAKATRQDLAQFLAKWKSAWESKDLENYMSYYSEKFVSLKLNKEQWRAYKQNLNEHYQTISVTLSQPVVFKHNNDVTVRMLQAYKSNLKQDFGEKTLYLQKEANGYKIIAESWVSKPIQDISSEGVLTPLVSSEATRKNLRSLSSPNDISKD